MAVNYGVFLARMQPEEIIFKRNIDGTYKAKYKGVTGVDKNNTMKIQIEIPRCLLEWEIGEFLIQPPKIKEVLTSKTNDELFSIIISKDKPQEV